MELILFSTDCWEISSRSEILVLRRAFFFFLPVKIEPPAYSAKFSWIVFVVIGKLEGFSCYCDGS